MFEDPLFADRVDAGRRLAEALAGYKDARPVVLALPRGGVPVGYRVAEALDAPLDVLLVRKIGAPGHEELGVGAVVDGTDPQTVWNEDVLQSIGASKEALEGTRRRELREIERRRAAYRGDREPEPVRDRTAIVVDDGIATGGTVRAALAALARGEPATLVLAVPVAPPETIRALKNLADDVVCLATPSTFMAIGAHYRDFAQTSDEEVTELLRKAAGFGAGGAG
jgi:putative phosphoribosyl transferase